MERAFLRQEMLLGPAAMARLREAHVAVFGIGGVGSWCAEALVRGGVGRLTFVDNDEVGETNLNRQLIALRSTLGRNKAEVMAERALDIDPDCRVRALPWLYREADKARFFDGARYDYVVDCIDTVSCKLSLIPEARARQQAGPLAAAGGRCFGDKGLSPGAGDAQRAAGAGSQRTYRRLQRGAAAQAHPARSAAAGPAGDSRLGVVGAVGGGTAAGRVGDPAIDGMNKGPPWDAK